MKPTDDQLESISKVLVDWNPLGAASARVSDLNGYQTEAEDIAFGLEIAGHKINVARMTRDVLNGAFGFGLSVDDCLRTQRCHPQLASHKMESKRNILAVKELIQKACIFSKYMSLRAYNRSNLGIASSLRSSQCHVGSHNITTKFGEEPHFVAFREPLFFLSLWVLRRSGARVCYCITGGSGLFGRGLGLQLRRGCSPASQPALA